MLRPFGELLGIALLAVGALMLGGLLSYQGGDGTLMGPVGHLAAGALYASFGMASYLIALGVLAMGVQSLLGRGMEIGLGEGLGFAVATTAGCVLLHVMFPGYRVHGYTAGGLTGELVGEVSLGLFHHAGTYLVALAVMCAGLLASTPLSSAHLIGLAKLVWRGVRSTVRYLIDGARDLIRAQREAVEHEDEVTAMAEDEASFAEELDDEIEEDEFEDGEELADEGEDEGEDEAEEAEVEPARPRRSRGRTKAKSKPEDEAEAEVEEESVAEAQSSEAQAPRAKGNRRRAGSGNRKRSESGEETEAEPAKAPATDAEAEDAEELPEIVIKQDEPAGDEAGDKVEGEDATSEPAAESDKPAKKAPPRPEQLRVARSVSAPAEEPRPRQGIPGVVKLSAGPYQLPPVHLFEAATTERTEVDRGFVLEQAQRLVSTLAEFRIKGKVTKIHPGPVITRYEFKPEAGTKLSKIESLENDLAMALEAIRIRILAPIPGKATVGFEVPNKTRETVYIKEILEDEGFGKGKRLPMALGKDITGNVSTCDLAKAPHLLVAGATGSGKSVGVNAMICSLLYTSSPEDVRMIMIDPKMLELSIYEGIPHLLLPVVTDPEKSALALRWAVNEMERRYALLSEAQVRDIAGYNRKLPELQAHWEHEIRMAQVAAEELARDRAEAQAEHGGDEYGEDGADGTRLPGIGFDEHGPRPVIGGSDLPDRPSKLPYIVVIIDEFADLMMVASKEVEQSVARIAAKARAAGIHLIVATQRPSVDVITGTIKNNFPSRIAFQVTSDADSRTILDGKGAKQLLGMGDMLHMDRGTQPQRVHGCYVSEDEILEVVKFVKKQARPVYNMDIVRKQDDVGGEERPESFDPLYDRAVEIVAESGKVSTSMLQRRLNVGYNRAAKIVEAMEEQGVIGPARGTAPREVYVSAA
ncbi:FtsK/SpoIIIE family DNA translocase [Paraliomyxa miuraensis]|uniref:FtsK/SpoIIIE family DNA translocase n=1 Tax=Paraliomyxa miuraensis TaxID=376150 RepID=UPI0022560428|nr:DNA translocase FtsK 4TM domain-containing protein [Paraliomyxa miuraensis]MCX4243360.1 DNA translocase FtsK 4TM domain-containing protein [Paraliomyxa miuraensis]